MNKKKDKKPRLVRGFLWVLTSAVGRKATFVWFRLKCRLLTRKRCSPPGNKK